MVFVLLFFVFIDESNDPEFDSILPPQLSLSTPELGVEVPVAPKMRRCVSSTELLYEKAMQRFYKAVEFEETENLRRSASVEPRHVPHELPSSRRRLSSFGEADALERRNSLRKNVAAKSSTLPAKLSNSESNKSTAVATEKPGHIDEDTISISEDRDLKREIMDAHRKLSVRRDNLTPTSSMEFDEDYTDSTASSGSMTSMDSMEQFKNVIRSISKDKPDEIDTFNPMMSSRTVASSVVRTIDDGAIDTFKQKSTPLSSDHPNQEARFELLLQQSLESTDPEELLSEEEMEEETPIARSADLEVKQIRSHEARALSPYRSPEPNQSSIALTRPFALPDPDFVPKPILKRPSIEETPNPKEKDKTKTKPKKAEKPEKSEKKGGILQMFKKNTSSDDKKDASPKEPTATLPELVTTKTSAAALAKKKSMERRQSSLEENKVAIDHYSDLVSAASAHRTPKVPIYLNVDDLKKVAEKEAAEKRKLTTQSSVTSNVSTTSNTSSVTPRRVSVSPVPPTSKSKDNDNRSIFAIKLSKDPKKITEPVKPIIDFSRSISIEDDPPATSKRSSVSSVTPSTQTENAKSPTRGRSAADDKTKKRTPSGTRSRSSSTIRKTSTTRDPSQTRPPTNTIREPSIARQRNPSKTRTASKTRNPSQSKSPSGRNRVLHVARISISPRPSSAADSPEPRSHTPEQLLDEAEKTIKSTMAYAMDISMLIVACWVYMFKDARLVVPILVLLVYRQVSSALKDRMPNWMKRKRSSQQENE